jgi:hypothetical protein
VESFFVHVLDVPEKVFVTAFEVSIVVENDKGKVSGTILESTGS